VSLREQLKTSGLVPTECQGETASFRCYTRKPWSTYFGPKWEHAKVELKRGLYFKAGQLERVGRLLVHGFGNREIARRTGAHTATVARARHVFQVEIGITFFCPCGDPATHRGWCRFRFRRSRPRQAFMRRWHSPALREVRRARRARMNPLPIPGGLKP